MAIQGRSLHVLLVGGVEQTCATVVRWLARCEAQPSHGTCRQCHMAVTEPLQQELPQPFCRSGRGSRGTVLQKSRVGEAIASAVEGHSTGTRVAERYRPHTASLIISQDAQHQVLCIHTTQCTV